MILIFFRLFLMEMCIAESHLSFKTLLIFFCKMFDKIFVPFYGRVHKQNIRFTFPHKALHPHTAPPIYMYISTALLSIEYYHLQYAKKTDVVYPGNHSVNKYFLIKHFITSPQLFAERQRLRLPCIERCLIKTVLFWVGVCVAFNVCLPLLSHTILRCFRESFCKLAFLEWNASYACYQNRSRNRRIY